MDISFAAPKWLWWRWWWWSIHQLTTGWWGFSLTSSRLILATLHEDSFEYIFKISLVYAASAIILKRDVKIDSVPTIFTFQSSFCVNVSTFKHCLRVHKLIFVESECKSAILLSSFRYQLESANSWYLCKNVKNINIIKILAIFKNSHLYLCYLIYGVVGVKIWQSGL